MTTIDATWTLDDYENMVCTDGSAIRFHLDTGEIICEVTTEAMESLIEITRLHQLRERLVPGLEAVARRYRDGWTIADGRTWRHDDHPPKEATAAERSALECHMFDPGEWDRPGRCSCGARLPRQCEWHNAGMDWDHIVCLACGTLFINEEEFFAIARADDEHDNWLDDDDSSCSRCEHARQEFLRTSAVRPAKAATVRSPDSQRCSR